MVEEYVCSECVWMHMSVCVHVCACVCMCAHVCEAQKLTSGVLIHQSPLGLLRPSLMLNPELADEAILASELA